MAPYSPLVKHVSITEGTEGDAAKCLDDGNSVHGCGNRTHEKVYSLPVLMQKTAICDLFQNVYTHREQEASFCITLQRAYKGFNHRIGPQMAVNDYFYLWTL